MTSAPTKDATPDWKVIAAECGIAVRSATRIGEGWEGVAWLVNGELVVKLLKNQDWWASAEREVEFLRRLPPLPAPVPEHVAQVRESRAAAGGIVVYRYMPGVALEHRTLDAHERTHFAARLGEFLHALHTIDVEPFRDLLEDEDPRAVIAEYFDEARRAVWQHLDTRQRQELERTFREHWADAEGEPRSRCVIHADFSVDHIIADGDRLTGVIDWTDACIGDPDYDFSYLYEELGEPFVREVGRAYGHRDIDRLVRRARYYTMLDQIGTIARPDHALPGDVDSAWQLLHAML